jgi:RNA polymerase sigma-70 factor (ECF subfamily)
MRLLFMRHNVRVFRFALRLVGNRPAAEDIVNGVFFDVWRQAGSFKGKARVSTWLLAITRNKAFSVLGQRSHEQISEQAMTLIEDPADTPEDSIQRKEAGAILVQCLQLLSPGHREIIDLVYYHQKTIDEVSAIVHAPRNTVKTRMFYARKRLAELLTASGVDGVWLSTTRHWHVLRSRRSVTARRRNTRPLLANPRGPRDLSKGCRPAAPSLAPARFFS